jgi:hypothetical protein
MRGFLWADARLDYEESIGDFNKEFCFVGGGFFRENIG